MGRSGASWAWPWAPSSWVRPCSPRAATASTASPRRHPRAAPHAGGRRTPPPPPAHTSSGARRSRAGRPPWSAAPRARAGAPPTG
ncbi:hypothetical protein [Ornithinimicrobium kibberense]|uniref:hypothetical protein n=1 Tax=Ornithinimicrobium kibberense TaxID=282060 RepID=UPI0036139990